MTPAATTGAPSELAAPHALAPAEVARRLGVDAERGLGEGEARSRLEGAGPNLLPTPRTVGPARIAARQFADPLVALAELGLVFSMRSPVEAAWSGPRNRALLTAVAASAAAVLVGVYLPAANAALATAPLALAPAALVIALALAPVTLVETAKRLARLRAARSAARRVRASRATNAEGGRSR